MAAGDNIRCWAVPLHMNCALEETQLVNCLAGTGGYLRLLKYSSKYHAHMTDDVNIGRC
jgi:hypothetical protein